MTFDELIRYLGGLTLLYAVLKTVQFLATLQAFFLRRGKRLRKYGEWAVVTGATDGIGRAYAFELAKNGMNVLLVSRTEEKLQEAEKELKQKYPKVEASHLSIDFSNFDAKAREEVKKKIEKLDVGVLINNVGISYPFTKYFHELKDDEVSGLVEINVNSTVWMTRLVLGNDIQGMISRRRGAIVNTSSAAGRMTSPLLAEYSGAKSFNEMFSKGLKAELAPFKIHVQCQAPLFVATKMAKIRKTSLTVPSPQDYARSAVAHIGYEDSVSPYWSHALQLWLQRQLPEWLIIWIVGNMHRGIRKAGMKKEARLAEEAKKGQ